MENCKRFFSLAVIVSVIDPVYRMDCIYLGQKVGY